MNKAKIRMKRSPHIITGQFVRINQTPASLGHRMAAQLIDWGIELVWLFAGLWLISIIDKVIGNFIITRMAYVLLLFVPIMFYSLLWELLNHGQTPGKLLIKLRVVKTDGSSPSLGALVMRWLLWIADGPTLGFLGIFVMLVTRNHQRFGDMAAGTMVIKLASYNKISVTLDEFDHLSPDYKPFYPQAADLSLEQVNLITQTLKANPTDPHVMALANKVRQVLGITHVRETNSHDFLERIVRDYQYYALQEV
jgi:uncharacterized RDD family membrane protein YckC